MENGTGAQKWSLVSNSDGTFSIKTSLDSAKGLDVDGMSDLAGKDVHLWECHDAANQKWAFIPE